MMLAHLVVDIAELGVAVRVLGALDLLGRGLQAVAGVVQQPPHQPFAAPVPPTGQRRRQLPRRLDRPPQRRLRVAAGVRVDQALQRRRQLRIHRLGSLAPRTGPANPARIGCAAVEFVHTPSHRRSCHPGRARHHRDPAPPGLTRLHRRPQPALPLIQHRRQQRKLARYLAFTIGGRHHITQSKTEITNVALIYSRVLSR